MIVADEGITASRGSRLEKTVDRGPSSVPWLLAAACLALQVAGVATSPGGAANAELEIVPMILLPVVGALILRRQRDNVIGWLLVATGVSFALEGWGVAHVGNAVASVPEHGAVPTHVVWAAWVAAWAWVPGFVSLFLYLPLLFPNGRLPSPRWRPLLVVVHLMMASSLAHAVRPGALEIADHRPDLSAENPLGIAMLARATDVVDELTEAGFLVVLPLVLVALGLRLRRSVGTERLQLKWFVYAVAMVVLSFLLSPVPGFNAVSDVGIGLAVTGMVVAIGVAVTRYHLYEIDRLISRTVSYGVVTVVLLGVYAGGVLGLGALVPGRNSDLLVAGSTLLVAALFQPVRRRVQVAVDRRFNRSRYDAQRMLAAYAQTVRDEVDLAALTAGLVTTTSETVQPAHASVWLVPSRS